jgi:hypothetical protein
VRDLLFMNIVLPSNVVARSDERGRTIGAFDVEAKLSVLTLVEDSVGGYQVSHQLETVTTGGVDLERLSLTLRLRQKITTRCEAAACYMLQDRYNER